MFRFTQKYLFIDKNSEEVFVRTLKFSSHH